MILGLDVSISCTGWAILNDNKNILAYGKIQTKKEQFNTEDERMCFICDEINKIIIENKIKVCVIEDQFTSKNSKTILALRKLVGAIMRTVKCENVQLYYMYPTTVRKFLMNNGKAKKEDVSKYIRKNIIDIGDYIDRTCKAKNSDIYDAIAVGVAYLNSIHMIES